MTLYEPAFAVVARRYGANSRGGITALTLWGGFASTVFVPLTQLLLDHLGWRDTLMALGAINLALCVALHLAVIDPKADAPEQVAASGDENRRALVGRQVVRWALAKPAFWALLVSFTVYYGTFSAVTYHLYPLEPIHKDVESRESVVIHCLAPESLPKGALCGSLSIAVPPSVTVCAIRAT